VLPPPTTTTRERHAQKDALCIFAGDSDLLRGMCADAQDDRLVAAVKELVDVPYGMVELELYAGQAYDRVDLLLKDLPWQAIGRDTHAHHAAGHR
jgi:hypothetical protein